MPCEKKLVLQRAAIERQNTTEGWSQTRQATQTKFVSGIPTSLLSSPKKLQTPPWGPFLSPLSPLRWALLLPSPSSGLNQEEKEEQGKRHRARVPESLERDVRGCEWWEDSGKQRGFDFLVKKHKVGNELL